MNQEPLSIIVFGATGDLAKKKLLPAFYNLFKNGFLQEDFKIIGFSRKDLSHQDYREFVHNVLFSKNQEIDTDLEQKFLNKIFYKQGDILNLDSYDLLKKYLIEMDQDSETCSNKLFYLAVPPNLYEPVFKNLHDGDLVLPCKKNINTWTRVLVEKPFGTDEENAKKLDKMLGKSFDESQIFRIDHYLAKEALQNIITFRFANAIFEPLWNKDFIERVEIKLHESVDIMGRTNFYDDVGALRDVGQNHILQMLALIAMDDPRGLATNLIRNSRKEVLSRVSPYSRNLNEYAFRAQYNGYEQENQKASQTETFFRLKLMVKNRRWDGVPFLIESGKALDQNKIEIKIIFKDRESAVCRDAEHCTYNNTLTFQIQPENKISIGFWVKESALDFNIKQKDLSFTYSDETKIKDAYEKVLYDCIRGDQTLFTSTEEVATQWNLISKISHDWQKIPLIKYEKGAQADDIKN